MADRDEIDPDRPRLGLRRRDLGKSRSARAAAPIWSRCDELPEIRQLRRRIVPDRNIVTDKDRWHVRKSEGGDACHSAVMAMNHVERTGDRGNAVGYLEPVTQKPIGHSPFGMRVNHAVVPPPPHGDSKVARQDLGPRARVQHNIREKNAHGNPRIAGLSCIGTYLAR